MTTRVGNPKNFAAGLLFVVIGAAYAVDAYFTLEIGTAQMMGPGYFPLVLAGSIILIGALIVFHALREGADPIGPVPWRAVILVTVAPLVFALTLDGLGFVPATAVATAIASCASRVVTLTRVVTITVVVTLIAVAVFLYGFSLPAAPFGPWLGF